jgi:hypothetical protein
MHLCASIRAANTPRALPIAHLFSEASGHPSISTCKEVDFESGNDYFQPVPPSRGFTLPVALAYNSAYVHVGQSVAGVQSFALSCEGWETKNPSHPLNSA